VSRARAGAEDEGNTGRPTEDEERAPPCAKAEDKDEGLLKGPCLVLVIE
jgi:hypothetical protein